MDEDFQNLRASYSDVYAAQVEPVQTVDVGAGQPRPTHSSPPTVPPEQPTSRWGGRGNKRQPPQDPYADMRGKALRLQAPLLQEWRTFAILAAFLFIPSAKVIGMANSLSWIIYSAAGGGLSLLLMWAGVKQEKAKLGALAWKVAVMVLLMPAAVYATAYGLTLLLSYSGFKF